MIRTVFYLIITLFGVGCDQTVMKDDSKLESSDDELIMQIQNYSNKVEIVYNDLPIDVMSTLESTFYGDSFLSKLHALGLGYEFTYSQIDSNEPSFKKIYFNLEGRKLISEKDKDKIDQECFRLSYPVTFIMPDESNITIYNDEDWDEIKIWYNSNDTENRPDLKYPVDIIYSNGEVVTISTTNEMLEAKSSCVVCIELVYPVVFILPNQTTISVESNTYSGWEELKNWYQNNPNSEFNWNMQYPIDIILEDGTTTTVNSLSEIEILKQDCM